MSSEKRGKKLQKGWNFDFGWTVPLSTYSMCCIALITMWVVPQKKVRLRVFLFREWGKLCHKKPGKKHTLLLMSAYETWKYTEGPFKWWRLKLSSGSRKHRIQIKGGLLIQDIIRTHRLSLAEDVTIEGEFFFFFLQTSAWHTHTHTLVHRAHKQSFSVFLDLVAYIIQLSSLSWLYWRKHWTQQCHGGDPIRGTRAPSPHHNQHFAHHSPPFASSAYADW